MKPPKFAYHAPALLDEVVQLLVRYAGDARPLAGGQSLVPMLNFRLTAPAALIDLRRVDGLAGISIDGSHVRIGAMTRQRAAESSDLVARHLPLLRDSLGWVGHLPTRSRGTVGGSIAHADPSAELPMTLLALDGEVLAHGPSGARTIAADEFFDSFFSTALRPDEVLTAVRIPIMAPRAGYAIEEYARRTGDFAIAGVAVVVEGEGNSNSNSNGDGLPCTKARITTAGIGGRSQRLRAAENVLLRDGLSPTAIKNAARVAAEIVDPTSDPMASSDYRRHLIWVLTERALARAAASLNQDVTAHG